MSSGTDTQERLVSEQEEVIKREIILLLLSKQFRTNLYHDNGAPITLRRVKKILRATIDEIEMTANCQSLKELMDKSK